MKLKLPDLKDPDIRLRSLLFFGAFLVLVLFVIAIAFPLASNPTFCGKACHNQNPEWQAWKKSSHAAVTCYACHMNRYSPTNLLKLKLIDAPTGIFNTLTNRLEKPINKESEYSQYDLPTGRCLRCHSPAKRRFTPDNGLKITSTMHLKHLDAGLQCATCHNRIAHNGAENYEPLKSEWEEAKGFKYKNFLTMKQGCFRCHSISPQSRNEETLGIIKNGKVPPKECTTCHSSDFPLPKGHGQLDWRKKHGPVARQNFSYCFGCHDSGAQFDNNGKPWCTLCHDDLKVAGFKKNL